MQYILTVCLCILLYNTVYTMKGAEPAYIVHISDKCHRKNRWQNIVST